MKTLTVSISDLEYNQLGINGNNFSFTEFVEIINREISKQALSKTIQLAEKYKLSKMTSEEIDNEVKAVRNAKNNH